MVSPRLRCLLLLLSFTASISSASAAQRDSKLRLLLQRSPLGSKQDVSRYSLAELLSDLLQSENEALEEDFPVGEPEDVHVDLERAAGPLLAPRERKAGCKNFFWKTFTSC
ncbi:somatostatin 1, tandem duplicate 1 [Centroberyx gerrardi]|uniref:somatostatin 1, tandem duplicate 1 n=1 Tax=Centroberyx gerrardi TaxID=166262 RepID=UPI003AB077BF